MSDKRKTALAAAIKSTPDINKRIADLEAQLQAFIQQANAHAAKLSGKIEAYKELRDTPKEGATDA